MPATRPNALARATCVALAVAVAGVAAADAPQRFTAAAMKADVQLLRDALDELHPSLHWYTPAAELDRAFDDVLSRLVEPLDEGRLAALVQPAANGRS